MWDGSQLTCARIGRLFSSDSKSHDMTWHDHSAYIDRSRTSSSDLYRSVSVSSSSYSYTVPAKLSKREEDAAVGRTTKNNNKKEKKQKTDRWMDGIQEGRIDGIMLDVRDGKKKKNVLSLFFYVFWRFFIFCWYFSWFEICFSILSVIFYFARRMCGWDNWDISLGLKEFPGQFSQRLSADWATFGRRYLRNFWISCIYPWRNSHSASLSDTANQFPL